MKDAYLELIALDRPHSTVLDLSPFGKCLVIDNQIALRASRITFNNFPGITLFIAAPRRFKVYQLRSLHRGLRLSNGHLSPNEIGVVDNEIGVVDNEIGVVDLRISDDEARKIVYIDAYRLTRLQSSREVRLPFNLEAIYPIQVDQAPFGSDLKRLLTYHAY